MKTLIIKTNPHLLIIILLCFAGITSCTKKNDPLLNGGGNTPIDTAHTGGSIPPPGGGQTGSSTQITAGTIFIAGYELDPVTGNNTAEYWRDGVGKRLTDGKNLAEATGIAVSGNDVYVSGYEMIDGIWVARYWKNGVAVTLSDGTLQTQATGIAVSGNDVYVCGYEINAANFYTAKYWKNGVAYIIPYENGSTGCYPYAIAVSGGDVYMAGTVFDSYSGRATAKYWKNTDRDVNVTGYIPAGSASARGIVVEGNDIYMAGLEQQADHTGVGIADLWFDGISQKLSDDRYDAEAYGITKSGIDLYTSGSHQIPGGAIYACYWKGSVLYNFSNGQNAAIAFGIAVLGNDVYGVGLETTDAARGYSVPRCWKNNTIVSLTSGIGSTNGRAYAITIAK